MTETAVPDPASAEPETKLCKVCAEPIKQQARICNHCKSYQDWRGHMGMSQSVLALLIALISVGTVFVPVVVKSFTAENSDLIFSLQSIDKRKLTFLGSNRGNRPGTVAHLFVWQEGDLIFEGELAGGLALIDEGKSQLLQFQLSSTKVLFDEKRVFDAVPPQILVYIEYTDFVGSQRTQKFVFGSGEGSIHMNPHALLNVFGTP
jgi:predicted nucleic acid-binding Zn ribbon protein